MFEERPHLSFAGAEVFYAYFPELTVYVGMAGAVYFPALAIYAGWAGVAYFPALTVCAG